MPPRAETGALASAPDGSLLRRWRRRFLYALVVAALVHLPLLPITLLFGLAGRLLHMQRAADVDSTQALPPIEMSVELLDPPAAPAAATGSGAAAATQAELELPRGSDGAKGQRATNDEGDDAAAKRGDATDDLLGLADLDRELATQPNVTMALWLEPMRRSPLAPKLRALLDCGPLGLALRDAGVEPLSDLDAALFAGAKLSDAAGYTMLAQHHLPPARLITAVSRLVRARGQWLDAGAAKIAAAGAFRVVMPAGPSTVLVAPLHGWQKIRTLGRGPRVPPSRGRALALRLLRPSTVFERLGVEVPARLEELRVDVYASSSGDVDAVLRFVDRDAALAAVDAPLVTSRVRTAMLELREAASLMSWLARFVGGARFDAPLPDLEFAADGRYVVAEVRLPPTAASTLLGQMAPFMCTAPKSSE